MEFYRVFAIKDWTYDKVTEYYRTNFKQKKRNELLDSIKNKKLQIQNINLTKREKERLKKSWIFERYCLLAFNG